jgi:hypothetical protein
MLPIVTTEILGIQHVTYAWLAKLNALLIACRMLCRQAPRTLASPRMLPALSTLPKACKERVRFVIDVQRSAGSDIRKLLLVQRLWRLLGNLKIRVSFPNLLLRLCQQEEPDPTLAIVINRQKWALHRSIRNGRFMVQSVPKEDLLRQSGASSNTRRHLLVDRYPGRRNDGPEGPDIVPSKPR